MTNPEPLRGSMQPNHAPARVLGSEEVDFLTAMQEEADEVGEEDDDDPGSD